MKDQTRKRIKTGRPPRADQARLTREIRLRHAAGGGSIFVETAPGEAAAQARRFRSSRYVKNLRKDDIRAAVYLTEDGDGYIIEISGRDDAQGQPEASTEAAVEAAAVPEAAVIPAGRRIKGEVWE